MTIKYLYNCYNLAAQVSRAAANHVIEFNNKIENLVMTNDTEAYCKQVNEIYMNCRWFMIGLYEASDRILYSILNKAITNDKQRIEQYIADIMNGKENKNG